jgi:glyoxylase-like metal-dependent hydrolase (beta-lactamase superfamily II)
MRVEQLRPHLWRWTAPHPDWRPEHADDGQGWEREVASAAVVRDDEFVLVDPQAPADEADRETFWSAVDRDVSHHGAPHVVLTVAWHRRSADEVAARYEGTRVWAYRGEAEGGPVTDAYDVGTELPGGLRAFDAHWAPEAVLWSPEHRALLTGDVLLGGGSAGLRLLPESWVPEGMTRADVAAALEPLLELPVEIVLPAHGDPVLADGAAALERALRT